MLRHLFIYTYIIKIIEVNTKVRGEIMSNIKDYISNIEGLRKERIEKVIDYINTNYPNAESSMDYAPKTKFPTYKVNGVYVAIANMKHHISIHFGRYDATKIIGEAEPRVKVNVGCVNIKDNIEFPIKAIEEAIDYCFK